MTTGASTAPVSPQVQAATQKAQRVPASWSGRNAALAVVVAPVLLAAACLAGRAIPLHGRVVVMSNALTAGQTIQTEDLHREWLAPGEDYFTDKDALVGLILARDVADNQALRHRDVLRPQVVATTEIPAGVAIGPENVALSWTAYQPGAATDLNAIPGKMSLTGIREGQAIISAQLRAAQDPGTDRAVFSLQPPAGTLSPAAGAGDRVALLFVPKKAEAATPATMATPSPPIVIRDAVIRTVSRDSTTATVVVAVPRAEESRVLGLLGTHDAIVYLPASP